MTEFYSAFWFSLINEIHLKTIKHFFFLNKIIVFAGERPYVCQDCDKRYSHYTDLKRHRYTHTGDFPFKCETCSKGFSKRSAMESHMKQHGLIMKTEEILEVQQLE